MRRKDLRDPSTPRPRSSATSRFSWRSGREDSRKRLKRMRIQFSRQTPNYFSATAEVVPRFEKFIYEMGPGSNDILNISVLTMEKLMDLHGGNILGARVSKSGAATFR